MRYAFVSDIHANRQAWQAVSKDIDAFGVDGVICLGDIVGYGPAPQWVLDQVYGRSDFFVLGNHDAVVAGRLDPSCFNDKAREVIDWTCGQLDPSAAAFFKTVPMLIDAEGFCCAHADYAEPDVFDYILEPNDAIPSLNACPEPLLFVGHTHEPCVIQATPDDRLQYRRPEQFRLEPDWHYVVNVGSVGDPRDGDLRASYVVLDLEKQHVIFRKIPFDVQAYREEHARAGLISRPAIFNLMDNQGAVVERVETTFQPLEHGHGIGGVEAPEDRMKIVIDPELLADMRELRQAGLVERQAVEVPTRQRNLWALLSGILALVLCVLVGYIWQQSRPDEGMTTAGMLPLDPLGIPPLSSVPETTEVIVPSTRQNPRDVVRVSKIEGAKLSTETNSATVPMGAQVSSVPIPVVVKTAPKEPIQTGPVTPATGPLVKPSRTILVRPPAPKPTKIVPKPVVKEATLHEIAGLVLAGKASQAKSKLGPKRKAIQGWLEQEAGMEQAILDTYKESKGRTVRVQTKRGAVDVRILAVQKGSVKVERTIHKAGKSAAVPWEFTTAHLGEKEYLKRASTAGRQPFYLHRGLRASKAERFAEAAHYFRQMEHAFGEQLAKRVEIKIPEKQEATAVSAWTELVQIARVAKDKTTGRRLAVALDYYERNFSTTQHATSVQKEREEFADLVRELTADNLVKNGDFDGKVTTGWSLEYPGEKNVARLGITYVGNDPTGDADLQIIPASFVKNSAPWITQELQLQRGSFYEVVFSTKTVNTGAEVRAEIGDLRYALPIGAKVNNTWIQHHALFYATGDRMRLKLMCRDGATGQARMVSIDDVVVSPFEMNPRAGGGDLAFMGHRYRLVPTVASFATARLLCERMGGHLLTLQGLAEWKAVVDHYKLNREQNFLLGLQEGKGKFQWVSGEPLQYQNWDQAALKAPRLAGANIVLDGTSTAKWRPAEPKARAFVCEWKNTRR